ncbi:recombinase family protein [Gleimia sp. 6138-11-ORH1]|uniref:recombinase family protein n=1 Tax=Gleimia sp. 6138-11-ORH1 TaxID=2973937 RepID=UPI0037C0E42E
MNRPKLNLMLQELPTLQPEYVITWKNDKLGHNRGDLLKIKAAIRNAGARLEYVEGIEPESILLEGFTDAFAEYYSLQL